MNFLPDGVSYLKPLLFSGVIVFTVNLYSLPAWSFRGRGCKRADSAFHPFSFSIRFFSFSGKIYPLLGLPPVGLFTFTVLGNALLLTTLVPLGMFCYNLLHFSPEMVKTPLYMFIGYRTEVSSLKYKKHLGCLKSLSLTKAEVSKKGLRGQGLTSMQTRDQNLKNI